MAQLGTKEETRPWSDTPELILSLIRSRLLRRDKIIFSAAWKSLPRYVREEDLSLSPCLIIYSDNHFIHPLQNLFFRSITMNPFPKGLVLAQNYGWLLMFSGYHGFFFNPSTNQRIYLRGFAVHSNDILTFTSPPISKDCEIVSFWESNFNNGESDIVIKIMKRGEQNFHTKHTVRITKEFGRFRFLCYCRTIFYKDEYCCMGKTGIMVMCSSKTDKHRIVGSPKESWEHFSASDCSHHMFEGEGDLWAVFIACRGKEVCVLKLNCTDMIWERLHDLEDRMVFVSHKISFMERTKVGENGNKIYFPRLWGKNILMFYCLATKRYYTVEGLVIPDEELYKSKEIAGCTWIKMNTDPPPHRTREKR